MNNDFLVEPSPREIEKSYFWFQRPLSTVIADKQLSEQQNVGLREARNALQISTTEMATRLGITRAGYAKFEANERTGNVAMSTLKRCAEVLDCDLRIQIRPRRGKTFSRTIWEVALASARMHPAVLRATGISKERTLSWKISDLLANPKFRRSQMWSRNHG